MNRTYALAATAGAIPAAWLLVTAVLYARADAYRRRSMRMKWRIAWTWPKLSAGLGLQFLDAAPVMPRVRSARHLGMERKYPVAKGRPRKPHLRGLKLDPYGVRGYATTLPKIGLTEWQKAAPYLGDAWGAVRVTVSQSRPGRITFRAVHRDPLLEALAWVPTGEEPSEEDFRSWWIGTDEYAQDARLGLANVPGMGVGGIPGRGKSSLIAGRLLAHYAPSRKVAVCIFDGKGGGDYSAWRDRSAVYVEDDLEEAAEAWRRVAQLRADRQRTIAKPPAEGGLGTRNFWNHGPSEAWPWVVIVVDEAQHYLREYKGADKESKRRAELAAEIRGHVEDIAKKGRSVGFFLVLSSQKPTGDAIPTAVRDVLPILCSFAQTTQAAAKASLGDDITDFPDASPVELQGDEYIGCMVTKTLGQRGFTRVRTPYVTEDDQDRIAEQVTGIRVDPWALLSTTPRLTVVRDETEAEAI